MKKPHSGKSLVGSITTLKHLAVSSSGTTKGWPSVTKGERRDEEEEKGCDYEAGGCEGVVPVAMVSMAADSRKRTLEALKRITVATKRTEEGEQKEKERKEKERCQC
ncbi:hypothetical protein E2542_SST25401 [Spatholobus suberectus]|nr:hypothetical protein E2542_SST25401 [Spatholobus suberectus]